MPGVGGTVLSAADPATAGRNGWQVTGAWQAAKVPGPEAASAVAGEGGLAAALAAVAAVVAEAAVAGSLQYNFPPPVSRQEDSA